MAKVGRAARVASKQRTEQIGTAAKTISAAETGELYFINAAAPGAITLPSVTEGAYFTLVWAVGSTSSVTIAAQSGETIAGSCVATRAGDAAVSQEWIVAAQTMTIAQGSGGTTFPAIGSKMEFFCDGSVWYVNAVLSGDNSANSVSVA